VASGLNMTVGCLFKEDKGSKEVKLLLEDRTTRKLRELKLIK
jgi:hypothetical protein